MSLTLLSVNQPPPAQINRWSTQRTKEKKPIWFLVALIFAVIFHLVLFWYLKKIEFFSKTEDNRPDEQTYVINTDSPEIPEVMPDTAQTLPDYSQAQEEVLELDEALSQLKNQDLDISTSIEAPTVAISMSLPAKAGELDGELNDLILNTNTEVIMEDLGTAISDENLAAEGQLVIKEGSMKGELLDQKDLIDNTSLQGVGGMSNDGVMKGYSSLDSLLSMSNVKLAGSKTALPSDLLFEYDSAELKAGARFGLMKLGMLIDRNPKMYCLLEGHSDLFGPDNYNNKLSQDRADAVKQYLVQSLKMNEDRILVKGFGKSRPLVSEGDQAQQAPNRRVDILMRNKVPSYFDKPTVITNPTATNTPQVRPTPPVAPKQKLVAPPRPQKAIVVEEKPPVPQRAIIVEETPAPKAVVVQPSGSPAQRYREILQARGIQPPPQRAIVVD